MGKDMALGMKKEDTKSVILCYKEKSEKEMFLKSFSTRQKSLYYLHTSLFVLSYILQQQCCVTLC
jgi:hypothetical protein